MHAWKCRDTGAETGQPGLVQVPQVVLTVGGGREGTGGILEESPERAEALSVAGDETIKGRSGRWEHASDDVAYDHPGDKEGGAIAQPHAFGAGGNRNPVENAEAEDEPEHVVVEFDH